MSKKRSPEVKKLYRQVARANHTNECVICGTKKKLTIHHINGSWHNNQPENLCILCECCHKAVHANIPEYVRHVELYQRLWIHENPKHWS